MTDDMRIVGDSKTSMVVASTLSKPEAVKGVAKPLWANFKELSQAILEQSSLIKNRRIRQHQRAKEPCASMLRHERRPYFLW